jgi:hypothetical protein
MTFLGPIKYLIIVHKKLFADGSKIGLCNDDYDERPLLIFCDSRNTFI